MGPITNYIIDNWDNIVSVHLWFECRISVCVCICVCVGGVHVTSNTKLAVSFAGLAYKNFIQSLHVYPEGNNAVAVTW